MLSGLIGRKLGMTQLARAGGELGAVTVLAAGPCVVAQLKVAERDGYEAVQLGFGRKKPSRLTKPERGHFAKAGVAVSARLAEFERRAEGPLAPGQTLRAGEVFKPGDLVDVSGISKGRGYAGVIKRHHFAGFPGSRGTHEYFRHGGSIGNRSYPGRVRKGLRMAGQMGNERVTVQNLRVVEVLAEQDAIVVQGAVPGPRGGYVVIRHAARPGKKARKTGDGGV
ncbi:MAG: 50S ribosomal protein L3 [Deltaproteobacteria bacterium]|nr:50S ribosomal protein L3 [Deltaproteobacteria bacterium]